MDEPKTNRKSRKIRSCRYGIVSLFVVTTISAVAVRAWLIWDSDVRPLQADYGREQVIVAHLTKVGAKVETEWRGPSWLKKIAANWQCMQRVTAVDFQKYDPEDDERDKMLPVPLRRRVSPIYTDSKIITQMHYLEEINLAATSINDDFLKELVKNRNLRVLDLTNTRITDAGVRSLGKLSTLRLLRVKGTQVSAEALEKLKVTNLELTIEPNASQAPPRVPPLDAIL